MPRRPPARTCSRPTRSSRRTARTSPRLRLVIPRGPSVAASAPLQNIFTVGCTSYIFRARIIIHRDPRPLVLRRKSMFTFSGAQKSRCSRLYSRIARDVIEIQPRLWQPMSRSCHFWPRRAARITRVSSRISDPDTVHRIRRRYPHKPVRRLRARGGEIVTTQFYARAGSAPRLSTWAACRRSAGARGGPIHAFRPRSCSHCSSTPAQAPHEQRGVLVTSSVPAARHPLRVLHRVFARLERLAINGRTPPAPRARIHPGGHVTSTPRSRTAFRLKSPVPPQVHVLKRRRRQRVGTPTCRSRSTPRSRERPRGHGPQNPFSVQFIDPSKQPIAPWYDGSPLKHGCAWPELHGQSSSNLRVAVVVEPSDRRLQELLRPDCVPQGFRHVRSASGPAPAPRTARPAPLIPAIPPAPPPAPPDPVADGRGGGKLVGIARRAAARDGARARHERASGRKSGEYRRRMRLLRRLFSTLSAAGASARAGATILARDPIIRSD